ncbi:MAG: tyrosine-protein phosphatase [Actinomycetia bacterium]|nr:tyrosine-protein phosphatase [Actinomycetes bacterium]MCP4223748.1 tyrosine-protein phosphatase [Actinomycetes bacterium]MCP5032016.1 tyrosine-protein phosphatase [Actinomycetes bacterium]
MASPDWSPSTPGALIELDGTMNLRDLGGWPATGGATAYGRLYRSDRLSGLSDADHRHLEGREIVTVIDLRYEAEVNEHPSRLWSSVTNHHEIPMGGDLADQRSFVERVLAGDLEGISDDDVAESYVTMLDTHADQFGQAIEALLAPGPALFHCTAGKDRTGLLSMLVLGTVGVSDDDIISDFVLSNKYRASRRIEQLRPTFEAQGLDIDRYRPALSAPGPAMIKALEWITSTSGTAERYLTMEAGVAEAASRLRQLLIVER